MRWTSKDLFRLQRPTRERLPRNARRPLVEVLETRLAPDASVYDVLTFHNDNFRSGANTHETVLNTANVNSPQFGRLFRHQVDGYLYAQPLYKFGLAIASGTHNVVFASTEHDSVYALDADSAAAGPNGNGVYWKRSFIDPARGITTVPNQEVNTPDIVPEVGITGTPVIDEPTGTLYVVAKTKEVRGNVAHYVHRLHALDITTGADKAVVNMGDTTFSGGQYNDVTSILVPGTGAGSLNGIVKFNSLRELQRPGLVLANGTVYVAFASHGDNGPYHGWVIAYTALASGVVDLSQRAVFNTSPDAGLNGIWQSGGAPAVDQDGNLFFSTGNGAFDKGLDGPRALGPTGGSLGYGIDYAATPTSPNPGVFYSQVPPITRSVAVKFDTFKSRPGETTISNSTGVYVNGHEPRNVNLQTGDVYQDLTGTPIDLLAGQGSNPHVFRVRLDYDGRIPGNERLTETITNTNTGGTFTRYYNINLSQYVQGNTAYVGFTAGTGGHNGKFDIVNWTYTNQDTGAQVTLADRDNLQNNGYAVFLANGTAQLTDGGAGTGGQGQSGSVFTKQQVGVRYFTTSFDFQILPGTVGPPADGLTFTVQNAPGGPNGRDIGESVVKLNPTQLQTGQQMTVADYFTPFNWRDLNIADNDLGSGATMLLPREAGSDSHPRLAVETGKTGQIYLIDRDNLGKYTPRGPNANLQTVVLGGPGVWASPAYWNNLIYYHGSNAPLRVFAIANAMISNSPAGEGRDVFPFPGGQPSISAAGNDPSTGIAWTVDTHLRGERSPLGPAVLHAYKAVPDPSRPTGDRLEEIWESDKLDPYVTQQPSSQRDQAGNAVKFVVPTITNGHVYVGTQFELDVYGLFPPETTQPPRTVQGLTGQPLSSTSLQISWQSDPSGMYYRATGFNIFRAASPDLSDATLVTQVGRDATSYMNTGLQPSTTYYYYVIATNQAGDSARSVVVGVKTRIAQPTVTIVDVCPNAISLSWTAVADDHYDLYRRAPGKGDYTLVATLPSDQRSYTDTRLVFGNYSYFVRASDQDGDSADSNPIGATVGPVNIDYSAGFPNEPGNLAKNGSTTFGGGEATLTNNTSQAGSFWMTSRVGIRGFATQFEFQFREGSVPRADGFTFTLQADPRGTAALGPTGGGLGYGPDGPPGAISMASVRNSVAIKFDIYPNTPDPSEGDNSTGIFTDGRAPSIRGPGLPDDIPDISINLNGTGVTLNSQSAKRVTLTYDGSNLTETIFDEGTQQSFTHSYTVNIRRFIGSDTAYVGFTGGTGGLWTIQSIKNWTYNENEANLTPRAPSNLRQTGDPEKSVTLQWNCNNGYTAQGYYVERSTSPDKGFVRVAGIDDPNTNTVTDTPDAPGIYYYRVQSFNAAGVSAYSNTATTFYQVPLPASNLQVAFGDSSNVDLAWTNNATNQTGFRVQQSTDGMTFGDLVTLGADATTYRDNTVTAPNTYFYRVIAFNDNGDSLPSNTARIDLVGDSAQQDIGNVATAGRATFADGTYTLGASGADIWGSADAFHFVYKPFSGDGEIVARAVSIGGNTDYWAKGGVMIRENLTAGSRNAFMFATRSPDHEEPVFQWRDQLAGDSADFGNHQDHIQAAPVWLRLVRSGNDFSGFWAHDNGDGTHGDWNQIGTAHTVNMTTTVYIGLGLTAHNNSGVLNTSMFDNVLVTPAGSGPAAPRGGRPSANLNNGVDGSFLALRSTPRSGSFGQSIGPANGLTSKGNVASSAPVLGAENHSLVSQDVVRDLVFGRLAGNRPEAGRSAIDTLFEPEGALQDW